MCKQIDVIMPVYNSVQYLPRAVESILNQTYSNIRLIVVDDNSTDNSIEIIEKFQKMDSRVELIRNRKNMGVAYCLNKGIRASTSEYIARMDSDDFSYPERIERQTKYLNENPNISMCGCDVMVVKGADTNKCIMPKESNEIKATLLFRNCIIHPTVMFRRSFFDVVGFYDEEIAAEDYDLWLRGIQLVEIANIGEVLFDYYYTGNNVSSNENVHISSLEIKRTYYKKYLNIDIDKYSLCITKPKVTLSDFLSRKDYICELYDFLYAVDTANEVERVFDKFSLRRVMSSFWNERIKDFYPAKLPSKLKRLEIRNVIYCDNMSLIDSIANSCGSSASKVYTRLVKNLNLICDYATIVRESKCIVYGTGELCTTYFCENNFNFNIIAYTDTFCKRFKPLFGKPFITPDQISKYEYDYIIISTHEYFYDIKKILIDVYGVSNDVIVPIDIVKFAQIR